jgi:hypothetical protein
MLGGDASFDGVSLCIKRSPFEVFFASQRLSSVSSMSNVSSLRMHRLERPSWSSLWSFSTLKALLPVEEDVVVVVFGGETLEEESAAGFQLAEACFEAELLVLEGAMSTPRLSRRRLRSSGEGIWPRGTAECSMYWCWGTETS